jgi:hypothetical protein
MIKRMRLVCCGPAAVAAGVGCVGVEAACGWGASGRLVAEAEVAELGLLEGTFAAVSAPVWIGMGAGSAVAAADVLAHSVAMARSRTVLELNGIRMTMSLLGIAKHIF